MVGEMVKNKIGQGVTFMQLSLHVILFSENFVV